MTTRRLVLLGASILAAGIGYLTTAGLGLFISPAQADQGAELSFAGHPADRAGERYVGSFRFGTASEMLADLGITVYPEDKVYAFPDPAFGVGSRLWVYRAQPIAIQEGKSAITARTWKATVGEALEEAGVDLGEMDTVVPPVGTVLTLGNEPQKIVVTRVAETDVIVKSDIAFKTITKEDATLERGVEKVEQKGSKGVLEKKYHLRREDGVEVSRVYVSQRVAREPKDEIVVKGTKVIEYGTGKASWYGGVPALTAAHRTLPFGTKVRVVNVANGKSVTVTIADRGPFIAGRVIDLSSDAFAQIASKESGVASVRLEKAY